ncbi:MAG TPA: adenylate/guanylate cyclase domain-containing protein [Acetobacteraceae bacterium]|jgi:adenylate cyclase|nr:adenylate/guanylate cyclase domain-containing protein [Acetobacteraceae bacterium]
MVVLRRGISPGLAGFAVLLALLAVWSLSQDVVRGTLRERTFDLVLPLLPHPARGGPSVVIVDIDRDALARFGAWPWSRRRLAEVVSAAAAGKPVALGIDILLAGTDRFSEDGDAMMAQAVSGAPSVLGFVLETANTGQDLPATPILSSVPVSLPGVWRADGIIGPVALIADAAQGFGALVTAADADGPIRRVPLLVIAGGVVRPGLAVEVIRLAQGAGALLIDPGGILHIGDVGLPLGHDATLRLEASSAVRVIPALNLIDDKAARDALAGRIVLIGSSAPELGGLRVTPASPATPSVLIQAEAVEAMLRGNVPVRPSSAWFAEPAGAFALGLLCLLLAVRLRPALAVSLAVFACLAWAVAAVAAVPGLLLLVDPTGPPVVAIAAFASALLVRFVRDEWRARLLRLSFEQHLAPEVVRRIAADPTALRLRGEMREITALFTDIEGFTSLTERADPTDLVALLDAYFDVATRIVIDHGGMIDKIVGDAIHAIYNAPFELEDHASRAVASALALLKASEEVRKSPLGQRLQLGRTRVGIETGPAIVGDVGGGRKLDYTAHGNAMNAAARLEAANKDLGSSICIGPGTAAQLEASTLRQIGTLTLRGQSGEIKVYTPVSPDVS